MTDLVSLLFIAIIPIDCKITNFPYNCLFKFISATSKERMITSIIFLGATPIINERFVSLVFVYAHLITQCYRKRIA